MGFIAFWNVVRNLNRSIVALYHPSLGKRTTEKLHHPNARNRTTLSVSRKEYTF
ncbi:MAG: hypothetical protein ACK5JU_01450 [Bacteroidales bacterium]